MFEVIICFPPDMILRNLEILQKSTFLYLFQYCWQLGIIIHIYLMDYTKQKIMNHTGMMYVKNCLFAIIYCIKVIHRK